MKHSVIKNYHLLIASSIIYTYLFWQQFLGINLLLFSALMILLVLLKNKSALHSKLVWLTLSGALLSGIMMLMLNSGTSKFAHIFCFFIFLGIAHEPSLKSIHFVIWNLFYNYQKSIGLIFSSSKNENENQNSSFPKYSNIFYNLRLIIIPSIILFVFYWLYYFANDKFSKLSDSFWNHVLDAFNQLFANFSFGELLFFFLGLIICSGIIYRTIFSKPLESEQNKSTEIIRQRPPKQWQLLPLKSLNKEFKMAFLLFASVNFLMLVVNYLDIKWVWFSFSFTQNPNLSQYVHEGTYFLILSILLSMGLVIYYFRKNLNFISKNRTLKLLATIWMLQNIIMTISVAVRNYHYIEYYALAYKRIGVIIFLDLTLIGLITMIIKIQKRKSGYYLMKINSMAVYIMMLAMSCVSWDESIAAYNLHHPSKAGFDVDFCLDLSPKTLPILIQNIDVITKQCEANQNSNLYESRLKNSDEIKLQLKMNTKIYLQDWENKSWQSWNYADAKAIEKLKNHDINF